MNKTSQEKIQEKIQEILDKCAKGEYIYRGESENYTKVTTGLYRQYCLSNNGNKPLIENENFFVSSVEKDIVDKARKHIRHDAPNIEVLTELQHYGGKTALLDFTKDINIALFFACDGNFDQDGRIILFETSQLTEETDIDYEHKDKEKPTYTLISPTGKSPRVIFQRSTFVHIPKGYLEEGKYETIKIESDIKEPLLNYLRKHFNIKTETVYDDIKGFISNQHKHSTAEVEFYRGYTNTQNGKFEEAIKNYDKAIELNPRLAQIYYNRGVTKDNLGEYKEAIKDYDKAIELNPRLAQIYYNRGNAKDKSDDHKEAIKDYDKAIELNPKNAEAYYNRGNAKDNLGNREEAIKDYDKAIELNPKYAEAYNNRGVTKGNLGNREEAIKDYDKAIELNPKNAEAYINRGNAKDNLGNREEAIKDYDKAIELNPKYAEAYINRGNAKDKSDDHKEAIKDYDKAIELNPQLAEAYYNRGNAKGNLGKYKEAIKDYTEAKRLFEERGNSEMVKQSEETIAHLKNMIKKT